MGRALDHALERRRLLPCALRSPEVEDSLAVGLDQERVGVVGAVIDEVR